MPVADALRDRSSRPKTMEDLRRSVEYSILAPGRTREEQLEYRSCERLLEDAGFRAGRVEVELVRKSASISQNLAYLKRLQWLGWLRLKGLANGWNDHGEEQAHRANADFVSTKVPGGFRRGDREKVGLEWGRPGAGWLGSGAGERGAEGAEDSRLHITTGSWCMASVNHRPSRELILTDEEVTKCVSLPPACFYFLFFGDQLMQPIGDLLREPGQGGRPKKRPAWAPAMERKRKRKAGGNGDGDAMEGETRAGKAKATKLERLLKLLREGGSREVRDAAAVQLARVLSLKPKPVLNVLNELKTLLYDKRWDARCAAARCMDLVAQRCAEEDRRAAGESASTSSSVLPSLLQEPCLSFSDVDLVKILEVGKPLLANSGKEYDVEEYAAGLTDEEKLREARQRLDKNMGLTGATSFFDSTEIVSNHDLMAGDVKREPEEAAAIAVTSLVPASKRVKREDAGQTDERELTVVQCFEVFSRDLGSHLFDEHWDIRHGAALGLRAILSAYGELLFGGAASNAFYVDFACRLVCVLALDRLGDFFSERTTAPVKETAAQSLGHISRLLEARDRAVLQDLMAKLVSQRQEWHVQHGGLLGYKYLVLGDPSLRRFGAGGVDLFVGLLSTDSDDDVFTVALENLILLIDRVTPEMFDQAQLTRVHDRVWRVLPELDDLHASVPNCLKVIKMVCGVKGCAVELPLQDRLAVLSKIACNPSRAVRLEAVEAYSAVLATTTASAAAAEDFWLGQLAFWVELCAVEQDQRAADAAVSVFEAVIPAAKLRRGGAYDANLAHLVALGSSRDYEELSHRDLKHHASLQMTNVLLGTASAGKAAVKSKRSAEAKLRFGYPAGRTAANVRVDVGRCLASYLCEVEGETALVETVGGLISSASYRRKLLGLVVSGDAIRRSSSPERHTKGLAPHVSSSVQVTYKGLSLLDVGATFAELEQRAGAAKAALVRVGTVSGKPQEGLLGLPLKSLLAELSEAVRASPADDSLAGAVNLANSLHAEASLMAGRLRTEAASCAIASAALPPKLNLVIQPLMDAVRTETDPRYRRRCGRALAGLIHLCRDRQPSPNAKLVKNLCNRATVDILTFSSNREALLSDLGPVRAGAVATLEEAVTHFGATALDDLPVLKAKLVSSLRDLADVEGALGNVALMAMLKGVLPKIFGSLRGDVGAVADCIVALPKANAGSPPAALAAYTASRALVELSLVSLPDVLTAVFSRLLPGLGRGGPGARHVLDLLGLMCEAHGTNLAEAVPYILVSVMPLLNAHDAEIRPAAAAAFSKMFPIFAVSEDGRAGGPPAYLEGCGVDVAEAAALQKIFNASEIEDFELPFKLPVVLRPYQREGLNWLNFLRRFGMNGILADDMGLGKTLQTLLILASALERKKEEGPRSIIVAPSTLVAHWEHEIGRYLPKNLVRTLAYVGQTKDRPGLRPRLSSCNCLITSYDVLRKESDWFQSLSFQYCVLDEGHLIKNPDSALSKACRGIKSEHRLILTGTPIQNDVLEIWSLFDFLMPGFLGDRKDFGKRFRSGVNAGRKQGSTKKDRDASILVADQLHKQISPFVLRRTKDQVLKDLPSKIIQDVLLEMSPVQRRVYDEVSGGVDQCLSVQGGEGGGLAKTFASNVHQLAKACTHPALALRGMDPEALKRIGLEDGADAYDTVEHSPKLVALVEVLQQCGILAASTEDEDDQSSDLNSPAHQILVFAQTKAALDAVERCVLDPRGIPYLRLDGDVNPERRHKVAMEFQRDPTIPVLLLTTRVGGLGLNLTAADTVFFLEHDWNPMMDMQAMDRAHRLGQTSTVNVFRAIVKDTYEERLMGVQRFKVGVAETVVSMENASVKTLNAGDFVDLFGGREGGDGVAKKKAARSVVEELERNWEEVYGGQYDANELGAETFQRSVAKEERGVNH